MTAVWFVQTETQTRERADDDGCGWDLNSITPRRRRAAMAAGGLHRAATSNHWLRSGVPFVTFMLAGSYGISVVLQGRNDVRDARADVTDTRAPSRTQTARRRNRAFDLDDERERTMDALGVRDGARDVKMVPVPRPWQEPGANGRRWWGGVRRWLKRGE